LPVHFASTLAVIGIAPRHGSGWLNDAPVIQSVEPVPGRIEGSSVDSMPCCRGLVRHVRTARGQLDAALQLERRAAGPVQRAILGDHGHVAEPLELPRVHEAGLNTGVCAIMCWCSRSM
jgi:hypothetical protein